VPRQVYHGRGFVPLALLRRAGEVAVAVDVFEDQHLNQDASGEGSEAGFNATLRRFGVADDVVRIHTSISYRYTYSDTNTPSVLVDGVATRLRSRLLHRRRATFERC